MPHCSFYRIPNCLAVVYNVLHDLAPACLHLLLLHPSVHWDQQHSWAHQSGLLSWLLLLLVTQNFLKGSLFRDTFSEHTIQKCNPLNTHLCTHKHTESFCYILSYFCVSDTHPCYNYVCIYLFTSFLTVSADSWKQGSCMPFSTAFLCWAHRRGFMNIRSTHESVSKSSRYW